MPQVSKRIVAAAIRNEMFQSLFRALARVSNERAIANVLDDVLTPTEKVMIAKRLMAAILIDRGCPYRNISELLKMSTTTINSVHREIRKRGDGYRLVFKLFPKRSKIDDILGVAERVLGRAVSPVNARAGLRRQGPGE